MEMDVVFLIKIEEAKRVVKSVEEKRDVFEAYVFKICANWEVLLEDLLIDCLNKDTTRYKECRRKMIMSWYCKVKMSPLHEI